ncbi:hypothetical protein DM806_24660 [Sphingobium lactosutens]|nr:hypothetical protein [Sphingobium lactosutens]
MTQRVRALIVQKAIVGQHPHFLDAASDSSIGITTGGSKAAGRWEDMSAKSNRISLRRSIGMACKRSL